MNSKPTSHRPLDVALRERLHLGMDSAITLEIVRAALHSVDAASRLVTKRPFFALKESEAVLERLSGYKGWDFVRAVLNEKGGTEIVPHGLDRIPESGPVVVAATHPTGMFDFMAHAQALIAKRPELKVVANREVEKFLGPDLIVPVIIDKQNRAKSGTQTTRAMQTHLENGGALLIFGSGRVPHKKNGFLIEPEWREGATRLSKNCQAPIIPAALDAQNSVSYYCTRACAQFLSGGDDNFGAMIGSLRYVSEFLDKLGGRFDVFYGQPLAAGAAPQLIKSSAEKLVPGLYSTA